MNIDFHMHGKIKKKFPFDKDNFINCINEAKNYGIDALTLTEHCHSKNFEESYDYLKNNYEYINECYYEIDGIKLFTGIEVTTTIDLDFIFIGNRTDINNFKNEIKN